jgi:hypothetical protein
VVPINSFLSCAVAVALAATPAMAKIAAIAIDALRDIGPHIKPLLLSEIEPEVS